MNVSRLFSDTADLDSCGYGSLLEWAKVAQRKLAALQSELKISRAEVEAQDVEIKHLEAELDAANCMIDDQRVKLDTSYITEHGRIKELEAELDTARGELKKWRRIRTPTHGGCCTCQECGLDHDECRCDLDSVLDDKAQLAAQLALANEKLATLAGLCERAIAAMQYGIVDNRVPKIVRDHLTNHQIEIADKLAALAATTKKEG